MVRVSWKSLENNGIHIRTEKMAKAFITSHCEARLKCHKIDPAGHMRNAYSFENLTIPHSFYKYRFIRKFIGTAAPC